MNEVVQEMMSIYLDSGMSDEEYIEHYGMPRRSGRYPWGQFYSSASALPSINL